MENEIYTGTGKLIKNYDDWKQQYPDGKDGHSAWDFGKFILYQDGLNKIQNVIENSIGEDVNLDKVFIEKGVAFDKYQRPSQRDMVIQGKTKQGRSVFISIEAKVAETFGGTIKSEYKAAIKYHDAHSNSKRAERIENLYKCLLGTENNLFNSKLRYQLFHAVASTVHETSDIGIMMVVELLSNSIKSSSLQRNKNDFKAFMDALHAKEVQGYEDLTYDVILSNKTIRCIFSEF